MMRQWQAGEHILRRASPNYGELLKRDPAEEDGRRAPRPGELFRNPTLANTFRLLGSEGKKGFYQGRVAEAIIKVVQDAGGKLDMVDLENHLQIGSEDVDPISLRFNGQSIANVQGHGIPSKVEEDLEDNGVEIWECPPNGQGIVALMALGILEELERQGKIRRFDEGHHNSAELVSQSPSTPNTA